MDGKIIRNRFGEVSLSPALARGTLSDASFDCFKRLLKTALSGFLFFFVLLRFTSRQTQVTS